MLRAVIRKGDPTSHGGQVLEGSDFANVDGRPIAQKGHMTYCPQCKGNFPISEGLGYHTFVGVGTALDGMRTACGAKLIATQDFMRVDDLSEAQVAAEPVTRAAAASFLGAFRAVDETTGQPVPGMPYRLDLPDGRTLRGMTDADGYTERVSGHDPATITLSWEAERPAASA
jgi:uncharacterized Zn-binding protein involved in type VI secretion